MRLAYFPGCKILFHLKSYGDAVEALMKGLGVTLVKLPFNCCGNPARGKNLTASVLAAVKNMAMAQARGLDIFTPCKCCFGQLKHGVHWYSTNEQIREQVDLALAEEGLYFEKTGLIQDPGTDRLQERGGQVRHLLDLLYHDIGVALLEHMVKTPLPPKRIVLQQGCHALRPFSVTQFDNPFAPRMFRQLAGITGLEVLDWAKETECCGDPAAETARDLVFRMKQEKLIHARRAGAEYICTACTHCQIQYDRGMPRENIQAVPFAMLLGAALEIKEKVFTDWTHSNI